MRKILTIAAVVATGLVFGMAGPCFAQDPPVEPVEQTEPEPVEEPTPEPEPAQDAEPVEEPTPEPEPVIEPVTLADVYGALTTALTARASHDVTVGSTAQALDDAREALAAAESAHGDAMSTQAEVDAGIRDAAQAFVDFLTAAYLTP